MADLIQGPKQLEHEILEGEDIQEEISNKIGEIKAFIKLQKSLMATPIVSQSRDSRITEIQGKDNPQKTCQSPNLDAQAFTAHLTLSSTTNTISVAVISNGVTTQPPQILQADLVRFTQ